MKINTRVTFNTAAVAMRIKTANEKALFIVSEQALKDCNMYAPKDQNDLIKSSETHSQPEKGLLVWSAPHARYQYYCKVMVGRAPKVATNKPLKYTRPEAHKMWAHYARSKHGNEWKKVYQNALRANLAR
jgi:hypothetical protein